MAYDVVVVGAGLGGLTVAALLAARGMKVCVLEKELSGGGCARSFEHSGYTFEPGGGLYASWQAGEIHERIFSELHIAAPEVRQLAPSYVVRLPDMTDVRVGVGRVEEFDAVLRQAFPECAAAAISFYRELTPMAEALQRAAQRVPDLVHASRWQRMKLLASEARVASRILATMNHPAAGQLHHTSERFRCFIDAQLQIFAQCASHECAYLFACLALHQPRRGLYAIRGGASALAESLTQALKDSGGEVRFNSPALRLAEDASGRLTGVDLLSGETVLARRAIISNLTVWDTFGKLVGWQRTPAEMRVRLKSLRGWGAYLLYLGMDEDAARERLSSERILALNAWPERDHFDPENNLFLFSAVPAWDARAPEGKRAVTVSTFTEPGQWFSFHQDETEHEAQDTSTLEALWERLHRLMPELGASVEVIETATPRTFYEQTRRQLGMVGGLGQSLAVFGDRALTHRTIFPNLFLVGDTTFPGQGIAAVTHSALIVANELAPPIK